MFVETCFVRVLAALLIGVAGIAGVRPVHAREWPSRPIRFIVPFGQGGLPDTVVTTTRAMVEERLGRRLIVEYRPGAGGNVGMQAVRQAPPDGYTIAVAPSNTMVINRFYMPACLSIRCAISRR